MRLMVLPPTPLASGVDCNGANKDNNLLTFVSLGLGAAGLMGCIPCAFIGLSHLLPLMVVKAVKFFYC
jgi:hypothetical protein